MANFSIIPGNHVNPLPVFVAHMDFMNKYRQKKIEQNVAFYRDCIVAHSLNVTLICAVST